jgi:PEP-CTERM motif
MAVRKKCSRNALKYTALSMAIAAVPIPAAAQVTVISPPFGFSDFPSHPTSLGALGAGLTRILGVGGFSPDYDLICTYGVCAPIARPNTDAFSFSIPSNLKVTSAKFSLANSSIGSGGVAGAALNINAFSQQLIGNSSFAVGTSLFAGNTLVTITPTMAGRFASNYDYSLEITAESLSAAVPEPSTWAFLILGFGAIGAAMRTTRRANIRVSYA